MGNSSASTHLLSERIPVSLFHFPMDAAKIRSRFSRRVRRSADLAWGILLLSRLRCSVPIHSLEMHFAVSAPAAGFLATLNFARLCATTFWKNMTARMVPFHVAGMAERHDVFGRIVSPISIYVMNLEALFCFAGLATGAKKALSRCLGEGLSFTIFFRGKILVPAAHFHGRTISATMGACPA